MTTPSTVRVNPTQCVAVARIVGGMSVPEDREEPLSVPLDNDQLANLYLFAVSICHQTQHLAGTVRGQWFHGWDFLIQQLAASFHEQPRFLAPKVWKTLTRGDLTVLLGGDGAGLKPTDIESRCALVNDLGAQLVEMGAGSFAEIYRRSDGYIRRQGRSITEALHCARAFQDPVKKKLFFLLELLQNTAGYEFRDPESIGPPVDYHEVRGHLRMKTIVVESASLRAKIENRSLTTQREDIDIRAATSDAIWRISRSVGITPSVSHYFFWNLFRNVCLRRDPECYSLSQGNRLPQRYRDAFDGQRCPFASVCPTAGITTPMLEHRCNTHYY